MEHRQHAAIGGGLTAARGVDDPINGRALTGATVTFCGATVSCSCQTRSGATKPRDVARSAGESGLRNSHERGSDTKQRDGHGHGVERERVGTG